MEFSEVVISAPQLSENGHCVQGEIADHCGTQRVWFRSEQLTLVPQLEVLLPNAIVPALQTESPIRGTGNVSRRLLNAVPQVMQVFRDWDPDLRAVAVNGMEPVERSHPEADRVGVFFSAGLDSFYTLLKHRDEITDLIFVHGFDIPLGNQALRGEVSETIRNIADRFGKRLVEVETNVREYLDPRHVNWLVYGHGVAMAGVGHALSSHYRKIFMAGSLNWEIMCPNGTHPLLDHLWSSESLEFVHDGAEASSVEKAQLVSRCDVALETLRVCWRNTDNAYNCGRCEKCVRRMIELLLAGALDRCQTFDRELTPELISQLESSSPIPLRVTQATLKALRASAEHRDLYRAFYRFCYPSIPVYIRHMAKQQLRQFKRRVRKRMQGIFGEPLTP